MMSNVIISSGQLAWLCTNGTRLVRMMWMRQQRLDEPARLEQRRPGRVLGRVEEGDVALEDQAGLVLPGVGRLRPHVLVRQGQHPEAVGTQLGVLLAHVADDDVLHRVALALDRHFLPGQLFRRHVGRRTRASVPRLPGGGGQPEVGEAHLAATVEHDVRGLQVAVQQALLVDGSESGAELAGHLSRTCAT
jgi:hypothetical protein